jgi:23S rRNA (cytosine1962-C5)-methyltransferase
MSIKQITVRPQGRGAALSGHPWMMTNSLIAVAQPIACGEVVELVDPEGRSLGMGLFNPNSRIAVRRYGSQPGESLDPSFFLSRLKQACDFRDRPYFNAERHALRLVFSEGDQFSGLIVDRYGDHLVIQQTSAALDSMIEPIATELENRYHAKGILHLVDVSTASLEGIEAKRVWIRGSPPASLLEIEENGLRWQVDLQSGQKTGCYHDQRENRLAAARWMPTSGKILDVCCYLGGFALTIAKNRPDCSVTGIDTSDRAVEAAQANAQLNGLQNVSFEAGDFFKSLELRLAAGESYDAIVVDPPKLAGSRDTTERALRAYHRLNYLAVRLLKPAGILVTCSCSGRVSRLDFWNMLRGVSKQAHRGIQIVEQRGAAPDHPILATCPETDYLKCFICRVA